MIDHGGRSRQRSHSYYSPEDAKKYGLQTQTEENLLRPRSRSFYSYDTSELHSGEADCTMSETQRPRSSSLLQYEAKNEKKEGDGVNVRLKKSKSKSNRHSPSRDLNGSRGSLKSVSMMTISESDNWEISSSSGMKYGQFVDWEKIDPEAAERYQRLLKSEHQEMKTMGREGFWAMPHTLRAKAYYHIIHGIHSSRSATPDRDVYYDVAKKLFGEQKVSNHPVPEYMEVGEIPRYCLNKAGLNSVKKILLCLAQSFPDMNFCPILPALVSLILHFSEDEAECFNSVCRIISYKDPNKRYIDQTFLTYRASCMTFGDLANRYCRGIRKLIASSHQNLFDFYSDWIMWIFADLPFTYAIRVLDVYLLEGYKVLYRVALALLSLYKVSVSSRVADVEDFRRDMKSFVQNVARHCTAENLLERAVMIQMATRRELNLLFNANKDSLMQKGVSIHQKRQSVQTVDFSTFSSSVVTGTEMRVVWAWVPERFALFSPVMLFSTTKHGRSLASFYSHVEGHEPAVLILKTVDEEVCGAFLSTDLIERKKHDSEELTYFGTGESFVFTLRPSMERYQQAMVNIMTRGPSLQQLRASSCVSSQLTNTDRCPVASTTTLTCPAGTLQDPSYLTVPFTAPSAEPMSAKEPKRPKEQEASMFIAGNDGQLFIGGDGGHALCLQADLEGGYTQACDTFKSIPLCKGHFKVQSLEVWGIQNSISFSGTAEVVVKVMPDSDCNDSPTPSASENQKQPESSVLDKCYPCSVCGKTFDRPSKLERHKPVHTKKPKALLQCEDCDKSFTQLEKLVRHQNNHNKTNKHPCPDCGKVFNRPSKLERHKRTHAKKPKVPHQCSYCMKTFSKLNKLVRHERMHTGEKPFTCSVCGKSFSDPGHCKAHEKTHNEQPEKPHCCADCGMRFYKASELRRHFRSHTGEKPFSCTLCNSCFSRSEGLKRHMRSHTGERPYKCIICGKGFYSRQDLNIHSLTHSGEKPHLCPVCGKGFSQLGNMKEHEQNVHVKSEKYICNECGATFTRYKSLTKHQRTHTGERPYLCLTCGRRFSWSHSLSRHRRTHTHRQMSMDANKDLLSFEGPSEGSSC
ncbi:TBC1 domain family member 24-like [Diretmus argenteus]